MTYLEQVDTAPTVLKSLNGDIWLGECNVHQVVRDADNEILKLKDLLTSCVSVLRSEGYHCFANTIEKNLSND